MALRRTDRERLVYSTDLGRMCPKCRRPMERCVCKDHGSTPSKPGDGILRVRRETKGRKGKTVTVVTGLAAGPDEAKALLKALKQKVGAGGSVVEGNLELQGDHRDKVVQELEARGFTVKRAGG